MATWVWRLWVFTLQKILKFYFLGWLSPVSWAKFPLHAQRPKGMDQRMPRNPFQPFFLLFYQSRNVENIHIQCKKVWKIFPSFSPLHFTNVDGLDESNSFMLESPEVLLFPCPFFLIINLISTLIFKIVPFDFSLPSRSSSLCVLKTKIFLCEGESLTHRNIFTDLDRNISDKMEENQLPRTPKFCNWAKTKFSRPG